MVGIDLVEVRRFARAKPALLKRLFTPEELKYCQSKPRAAIHLAGRFAAKEAFLKAMGTGYAQKIGWKEIEIVHLENGGVKLKLSGVAGRVARKMKIRHAHLSIAHTQGHAIAIILLER